MEITFNTNLNLISNVSNCIASLCKKYGVDNLTFKGIGKGTIYGIDNGNVRFINGARIYSASSTDWESLFDSAKVFADLEKLEEFLKNCYEVSFTYYGKPYTVIMIPSNNNKEEVRCGFDHNGTWYHFEFKPNTQESLIYCNIVSCFSQQNTDRNLRLQRYRKLDSRCYITSDGLIGFSN